MSDIDWAAPWEDHREAKRLGRGGFGHMRETEVRLLQNAVTDYQHRIVPDLYATTKDAARWIAREIIGNEISGFAPLPVSLKANIALAMVEDEFMGWPDVETALATLDDWQWAEPKDA